MNEQPERNDRLPVDDAVQLPVLQRLTTIDDQSKAIDNSDTIALRKERPSWLKEAIQIVVEQWFLVSLGLLIAIASQIQVPTEHQKIKRTVTSYLCISTIFFTLVSNLQDLIPMLTLSTQYRLHA